MSAPVTNAGKRLLQDLLSHEAGGAMFVDATSGIDAIEVEMVERLTVATVAMHRSDASIVFIRRLTMTPPGRVVYHGGLLRNVWNRTDCGLVIYAEVRTSVGGVRFMPEMVPCRRDTAERIGRPCERCRWDD